MKITSFFLAAAALFLSTSTNALVGTSWSISNVPASGLKDVTFPMSIAQAPHKSGYFFAQQFNFVGQTDVGYTGLQPRPDSGGKPVIHAVFSSFIGGTTTNDGNCSPGADGGPGVSCAVEFSSAYSHQYELEVMNTGGTTWTGTVVDLDTSKRVRIGSYTLPAGSQGIAHSQQGFVEYYPWNSGSHTCSSLPYTSVAFGRPTTKKGAHVGAIANAYEYGDCVGSVAFRTKRTTAGIEVDVGFGN